VNGRGRDAILQDMKRRIERNDLDLEISETIKVSPPCLLASDSSNLVCLYSHVSIIQSGNVRYCC
jgi:hypothetical protein